MAKLSSEIMLVIIGSFEYLLHLICSSHIFISVDSFI